MVIRFPWIGRAWIGILFVLFPLFSFITIFFKIGDIGINCKNGKTILGFIVGFPSFDNFLKSLKSIKLNNARNLFDEILLGILINLYFFGFFYFSLYKYNPLIFNNSICLRSLDFVDFLLFSFVTGTTVGYGDIIPLGKSAHFAVIFELIVFWLSFPIFISSLISAVHSKSS